MPGVCPLLAASCGGVRGSWGRGSSSLPNKCELLQPVQRMWLCLSLGRGGQRWPEKKSEDNSSRASKARDARPAALWGGVTEVRKWLVEENPVWSEGVNIDRAVDLMVRNSLERYQIVLA